MISARVTKLMLTLIACVLIGNATLSFLTPLPTQAAEIDGIPIAQSETSVQGGLDGNQAGADFQLQQSAGIIIPPLVPIWGPLLSIFGTVAKIILPDLSTYVSEIFHTHITGTSSIAMCNRYFDVKNYSRIVDPGININSSRTLPQDVKDHLIEEQKACHKCVSSLGMYTGIGCVPVRIESLLMLIVIVGLIIAGALALVCIITAAIKIQVSKGDSTKISKAQESVRSCVTGIIIIVFSALIVSFFGGGILGFNILQPSENQIDDDKDLQCKKECVYSEEHLGETKCYTGACPKGAKECGKQGGLNEGCRFADKCGNFKEVVCPAPTRVPTPPPPIVLTPVPSPAPPPPTTPGPGPGPSVSPIQGPVPGGPSLMTDQMVQDVIAFHYNMIKHCGSTITRSNYDCLSKMDINLPGRDDAVAVISNEIAKLGEENLQCVGYVKGILALIADARYINWGYRGPAKGLPEPTLNTGFNPDSHAQLNYIYIKREVAGTPLPGDLVKYKGGTYGHIGFVASSSPEDGTFDILDANVKYDGTLMRTNHNWQDVKIDGFYRLVEKRP